MSCAKLRYRRNSDLGSHVTATVGACCALCEASIACKIWAWHAEQGKQCHLHTAQGTINHHPGCYAGVMNRTGTSALN